MNRTGISQDSGSGNKISGTSILWGSENLLKTENDGLFLKEFKSGNCDSENYEKSKSDSISSIFINEKILEIEIQINANCCYSFLGEIYYENDTLNLIHQGYGNEVCFCSCCFGLTYKIETLIWEKVKCVIINGDPKTAITLD
jgi:hypothetical protein